MTSPSERDGLNTGPRRECREQSVAPTGLPIEVPETISQVVEAPEASSVIDVRELDWKAVSSAVDPAGIRARMRGIVERLEALLDRADGPGLLFDADRNHAEDRVIKVAAPDLACPLWIVGDLHGDLLALEAALALIDECRLRTGEPALESYSFCHPPPKICYSQPKRLLRSNQQQQ